MPGYSALELLPAEPRDLTDPEVWARSGWRSRARREAAAQRSEMPAPSPRGLSLAALLALTGVPAAGAISGALGGSGGAEAQAKTAVASRGSGVTALQRALGVSADGVFGPQTQKAVKAYQRNHGLTRRRHRRPPDPLARWAWAPAPCSSAAARRAPPASAPPARSPPAAAASRRCSAPSACPPTACSAPRPRAALKRWQGSHGLQADGVAGPLTRAKAGLGPGPVLKRGGKARSAGGGGGDSRVAGVIAAANRIASTPVQVRRRPRLVQRLGLRLLGLGLLRPARRRPAERAAGLRRASPAMAPPGRASESPIYANSGHAYMVVDGRRFDTSARSQTGNRWTSEQRSSAGYVARHPRVLARSGFVVGFPQP